MVPSDKTIRIARDKVFRQPSSSVNKTGTTIPMKNAHQQLSSKEEFLQKFNRLITYNYQDQLINVEQSLNEIRQTIMKHNIHCQRRKNGLNAESSLSPRAGTRSVIHKSTLKQTKEGDHFVANKFETVNTQRQKRVSFNVNPDLENKLIRSVARKEAQIIPSLVSATENQQL